ncbi:hypothetical protein E4T49_03998 [Aureobasidium sp. EXF-10728]|nr:hypothetical protein E4T49_03998 [Aureobasidium sp. EXF-10728]
MDVVFKKMAGLGSFVMFCCSHFVILDIARRLVYVNLAHGTAKYQMAFDHGMHGYFSWFHSERVVGSHVAQAFLSAPKAAAFVEGAGKGKIVRRVADMATIHGLF